jgi:hypothetical protein
MLQEEQESGAAGQRKPVKELKCSEFAEEVVRHFS